MIETGRLVLWVGGGATAIGTALAMGAYLWSRYTNGRDSITCVSCKQPIRIGDPIALYGVTTDDLDEFEGAYHADAKGGLHLVGCLRKQCASPDAYAGIWTKRGVMECP